MSSDALEKSESPEGHGAQGGHGGGLLVLALGSLGVVFGDIGTSPLYTFQECVGEHGAQANPANILGVLSLIFWSLMLVVTFKYVMVLMQADNHGEGGIMALLALVPREKRAVVAGRMGAVSLMVIAGAALLFGDGVITPAISVLSAIEGLNDFPALATYVVPITVAILVALFAIQRFGTGALGSLFGPVMLLWFGSIGVLGAMSLASSPEMLKGLSPHYGLQYLFSNNGHGFLILGSVVMAVTGGEALYADMGHFGRSPIRISWLALVFPSLILCYFGQGALLTRALATGDPDILKHALENPFFSLVTSSQARMALVFLSAAATIIASQGLISAVFSLTHQAISLGYFPRVRVLHTSKEVIGQIYLPAMNWALMIACVTLVIVFKKSSDLAAAYGLAVSGTMMLTSVIFYSALQNSWGWSKGKSLALVLLFLSFDLPFAGATSMKFLDGGYIPFGIGLVLFTIMVIWCRGRALLKEHFERTLLPIVKLPEEVAKMNAREVPGIGVYLTADYRRIPNSLDCQVRRLHSVFEKVVLLSLAVSSTPYVAEDQRVEWEFKDDEKCYHVKAHYGFMEFVNVPDVYSRFRVAADLPDTPATYLIGRENFEATSAGQMSAWQETIFSILVRTSEDVTMVFKLPPEQVIEIGNRIDL